MSGRIAACADVAACSSLFNSRGEINYADTPAPAWLYCTWSDLAGDWWRASKTWCLAKVIARYRYRTEATSGLYVELPLHVGCCTTNANQPRATTEDGRS